VLLLIPPIQILQEANALFRFPDTPDNARGRVVREVPPGLFEPAQERRFFGEIPPDQDVGTGRISRSASPITGVSDVGRMRINQKC